MDPTVETSAEIPPEVPENPPQSKRGRPKQMARVFTDLKNLSKPAKGSSAKTVMGPPKFTVVKKRKRSSVQNNAKAKEAGKAPKIQRLTSRNLDYAGKTLVGLDDARLPVTPSTHDLAHVLPKMVIPAAQTSDSDDDDLAELDLPVLCAAAQHEIRILRLAQRDFCRLLDFSSGAFSVWMRAGERRSGQGAKNWTTAGPAMKRFMYQLFLWLNLKPKDRIGIFVPLPGLEPATNSVATIPQLGPLLELAVSEMRTHNVTAATMAASVVLEPVHVVTNLLFSPLPWTMTPLHMRHAYGRLWAWLKLPTEKRLAMLAEVKVAIAEEPEENPYPDTGLLIEYVKGLAARRGVTVMEVVDKTCRHFRRFAHQLVNEPKEWKDSDDDEKAVYINLMRWATFSVESSPSPLIPVSKPGTRKTTPKRKQPVVRPKTPVVKKDAEITDVFTAKPSVQDVGEPFDEDGIKPLVVVPGGKESEKPTKNLVEIAATPEGKVDVMEKEEALDTNAISQELCKVIKTGQVTIKRFSQCLNVNRNYLGALFRLPVAWEATTALQKSVYRMARDFLALPDDLKVRIAYVDDLVRKQQERRNNAQGNGGQTGAKKVKGKRKQQQQQQHMQQQQLTEEELERKRQSRAKFTRTQSQALNAEFARNPKPSTEEKMAMADALDLPLRTVMVYFSNHRRRILAEKRKKEEQARAEKKEAEEEEAKANMEEPSDSIAE